MNILKVTEHISRTSVFIYLALLVLVFSGRVAAHDFSPVDSVGVKTIKGKKFILYKVAQGEGWFGIGRKYGLTTEEVQAANDDVKHKPLKPGQKLLIPLAMPVTLVSVETMSQPERKPILHKVKKKDTLYSIALKSKKTVEQLRQWNDLKSDNLQTGQKLIVGYEEKKGNRKIQVAGSTEPMGAPGQVKNFTDVNKDSAALIVKDSIKLAVKKSPADSLKVANSLKKDMKDTLNTAVVKGKQMEEHGKASFIEDQDINPNKYYALHRTAAKGTIIKVTNIMNKKQIYVKVIGTLPDTGDNNDLIIKISRASAMKLNVLDYKFQVVLNYFGE